MSKKMVAVRKVSPGKGLVLDEIPIPKVEADEVLVAIEAASLCGTDLHIWEWDEWSSQRIKTPLTIGHEFAGTVVQIGTDVQHVSVGDYVSAESHITCGMCFQCRTGQLHMCPQTRILGVDRDGAFAEYIVLPEKVIWQNDRTKLPPEIATLQATFEKLAARLPNGIDINQVNMWHKCSRMFYDICRHPTILDYVEDLIGSDFFQWNSRFFVKYPGDGSEVPWHQDAGYTSGNSDILRMVNVWTPLVPVNRRNGCMEFVPESHRNGVVQHNKDQYYLRIHNDALSPLIKRAIPIEINPKDVVIFSNLLFHRGLPNKSNHVRWSIDFRYQDATQPTLRSTVGHLLRSKISPEKAVRDATHWASLSFQ